MKDNNKILESQAKVIMHDLRTNMSHVSAYLYLSKRMMMTEEVRQAHEKAIKYYKELHAVLNELNGLLIDDLVIEQEVF